MKRKHTGWFDIVAAVLENWRRPKLASLVWFWVWLQFVKPKLEVLQIHGGDF